VPALRLLPFASMPTLNWIGKEAVVNHHLQVPFHLLKDVPDLACGDPGSGNLIVQKVIYCEGCLLDRDRLQAEGITIRQTPYEVKVS